MTIGITAGSRAAEGAAQRLVVTGYIYFIAFTWVNFLGY